MSEQQNAYLKAMGIDVWIERTPSVSELTHPELVQPESVQPKLVHPAEEVQVTEPVPVQVAAETTSEFKTETPLNIESLGWSDLQSMVTECNTCNLSINRSKTIFGIGKQTASLMIVGAAPNEEDEQYGEPFSGQAGKLLTAMLKAMGYQRSDVYISNLVKCRTLDNQEPSIDEVASCESYLTRQIQLVKPDLILALGSITAQRLLKSKSTMSRLRGQLHYVDGITSPIIVSYEPAYLLRSPNEKRKTWEDLQMAMKELSAVNSTDETSALDEETNT